jgi:mannose-6-phosphate isomerase-like protein (cupin superfamily)
MRLEGFVEKGWGSELIWVTNDKYCGKLLKFNKGARFSMHFHREKDESWYVLSGEFEVTLIDTADANYFTVTLKEGDVWRNEPLMPHQVTCIKKGVIIEVSTPDSVEDNYRIQKGDSQK